MFPGPEGTRVTATVHPWSILRAEDGAARVREMDQFVADLHGVAAILPTPRD